MPVCGNMVLEAILVFGIQHRIDHGPVSYTHLDVYKRQRQSCVKEILGELWQRIDVTFCYEQEGRKAVLVFPEHYEEAVENTPARILFTQHHGSGNNYRQCFIIK